MSCVKKKVCHHFQTCITIYSLLFIIWSSVTKAAPTMDESDESVPFASKLEYFYNRNERSQFYSRKCYHRPEHYAAFGRWANTFNSSLGTAMMSPVLPRATLRTVIEEDMTGFPILAGQVECPDHPTSDPYDHNSVMARALCPWYWRVNYDPQRIPAVLPEAVCRCPRAVTGNKVVAYECQPLMMQLRILKFDSTCSRYAEETMELATACVSTVHSSKRLFKFTGIEDLLQELPIPQAKRK